MSASVTPRDRFVVTLRDVRFHSNTPSADARHRETAGGGFQPKNWENAKFRSTKAHGQSSRVRTQRRWSRPTPLLSKRHGDLRSHARKAQARATRNSNCGHCVVKHRLEDGTIKINSIPDGPYCTRLVSHKLPHATLRDRHLQDGIDILHAASNGWGQNRERFTIFLSQRREEQRLSEARSTGILAAFA